MQRQAIIALNELKKSRAAGNTEFELYAPRLEIGRGEIVVLQGTSGSGKSTLLDILAMTLRPEGARLFDLAPKNTHVSDVIGLWNQNNINRLTQLRLAHIGYVLQTGGLLPFLTIRDNICLSARMLGHRVGTSVDSLIQRLGLSQLLEKRPAALSVGERQRVAIARAVVHEPDVILADEPTAAVDPVTAEVIFDVFLELVERLGITTVIASHDWQRTNSLGLPTISHEIERHGRLTRAVFWRD